MTIENGDKVRITQGEYLGRIGTATHVSPVNLGEIIIAVSVVGRPGFILLSESALEKVIELPEPVSLPKLDIGMRVTIIEGMFSGEAASVIEVMDDRERVKVSLDREPTTVTLPATSVELRISPMSQALKGKLAKAAEDALIASLIGTPTYTSGSHLVSWPSAMNRNAVINAQYPPAPVIPSPQAKPVTLLFVGGSKNGEREQIIPPLPQDLRFRVDYPDIVRVHEPSHPSNADPEIEVYRLQHLRGETKEFALYAFAGLNGDAIIEKLIENYVE